MSDMTMSTWAAPVDAPVSRLSYIAFEVLIWLFYAVATINAIARTTFRFRTFRRLDIDDGFLILATLSLTAGMVVIHILWPYMWIQNQTTLGQYIPGPDFSEMMLKAKILESIAANMTNMAIYAVKLGYLIFFRKLLTRQQNFMIWWWVVFAVTLISGSVTIIFNWCICTDFSINFLSSCSISVIAYREHIWLITTTVLDIASDALIISIPVMLLWKVKIPLKAKLGVAAALCLSLAMIILAILRITLGTLVPGLTDTIWTYFCLGLEASTAVAMISVTACRSTFGYRKQSSTAGASNLTPLGTVSTKRGSGEKQLSKNMLSTSQGDKNWYDKEDCTTTVYQPEIDERSESTTDLV